MLASHGAQLKCLGCVIEATGFRAAFHRGVTTTMLFFLRPRSTLPVSFFANTRDAVRWMKTQIPIAVITPAPAAAPASRAAAGFPALRASR
jgi:hypothetical protein